MSFLKGYRVIDCSRIFAAPACGMMLADLGAEVIKVESPSQGDETRKWGPPYAKEGKDACYFMSMNRNTASITLDFKKEESKEVMGDLIKKSDIFLHNFIDYKTPSYYLDYERLSKINPGLVYASVSGFGDKGPMARKGALDFTIQAMSGIMSITGEKGGTPYKVGFAVTDILTGQMLCNSILAALLAREKDPLKKGMKLDASLLRSSVFSMCYVPFSSLNSDFNYTRIGNNHPNICPYGSYKTKDQVYVIIGAATEQLFIKLCKVVGITDEEYSKWNSNKKRVEGSDEFNKFLQSKVERFDKAELLPMLDKSDIPYSEINNLRSLFEDEKVKTLDMTTKIHSEKYGQDLEYVKFPVSLSGTDHHFADIKEPPSLGQHTDEVLSNLLGYSEEKN